MCMDALWRFGFLTINGTRRTNTPNSAAACNGAASVVSIMTQTNYLVFPMPCNSYRPLYFCTEQNSVFRLITSYYAGFVKLKSLCEQWGICTRVICWREVFLFHLFSSIRLGLFYFMWYSNCWIFGCWCKNKRKNAYPEQSTFSSNVRVLKYWKNPIQHYPCYAHTWYLNEYLENSIKLTSGK